MPAIATVEISAGELLLSELAVADIVEKGVSEVAAASRSVECQYMWIIGAQTIKELIVDCVVKVSVASAVITAVTSGYVITRASSTIVSPTLHVAKVAIVDVVVLPQLTPPMPVAPGAYVHVNPLDKSAGSMISISHTLARDPSITRGYTALLCFLRTR